MATARRLVRKRFADLGASCTRPSYLAAPVILAILTSTIAGCSSTKSTTLVPPPLPAEFPHHTAEEIITNVALKAQGLHSLKAKLRIRYATPEESGTANLNIEHRMSDSLFVSVRVTLGIEAARALVTPDSFFVYDRVHKKLYYGEAEMVKAFFPTPTPLGELFPSLTGTVTPDADADWQISSDSLYYYLDRRDGRKSYTVDPRLWRVTEVETRTTDGKLDERRTFSAFDWFGPYVLPRRIEVERPIDEETVWVYNRSVEINPPDLRLELEIGDVEEQILVRKRTL